MLLPTIYLIFISSIHIRWSIMYLRPLPINAVAHELSITYIIYSYQIIRWSIMYLRPLLIIVVLTAVRGCRPAPAPSKKPPHTHHWFGREQPCTHELHARTAGCRPHAGARVILPEIGIFWWPSAGLICSHARLCCEMPCPCWCMCDLDCK